MTTEIVGAVDGDAELLKTVQVDSEGRIVTGPGGGGADATKVQGADPTGGQPVGNPVVVGGRGYDNLSTDPIVNNGDIHHFRLGSFGNVVIGGRAETGSDDWPNQLVAIPTLEGDARLTAMAPFVFNGTDWARLYGNLSGLRAQVGYQNATIMTAATAGSGTGWTAFSSQACSVLDISNVTGADIEYRRNATGSAMRIPDGGSRMVVGITNASQIEVRRVDLSTTPVTVTAEALS